MTGQVYSYVRPFTIHWKVLTAELPVRPSVRYGLNAEWSRLAVGNRRKLDCARWLAVRAGQGALDKLLSIGPDSFHLTCVRVCVCVCVCVCLWQAQLHRVLLGTCSVNFCANFSKAIKCLQFCRRGRSIHCLHLTYLRVPGKSHPLIPEWPLTQATRTYPWVVTNL